MKKLFRLFSWLVPVLILCGIGFWFYNDKLKTHEETVYRTAPVERGTVAATITATGTVEPEELVNVGAQVGGKITEFGIDQDGKTIDYGSKVAAGCVLARIDDSLYRADFKKCEAAVASAAAALLQADAQIQSAEAAIKQANAKAKLAELNWERSRALRPAGVIAQSDYETYQSEKDSALATIEQAKAQLALAQASRASALASQASAEAGLDSARYNLHYCEISSPVDGVIIDRRVNIGQTVISSMSAPSLFLLAKDLKKMQLWVTVNEADVGSIRPGTPVRFTVDAFPGENFVGSVRKVRLNATMSQNVVTYVVEVDTDNSSGRLLPYLTANVNFILAERQEVLSVPNAALRFRPAGEAESAELAAGEKRLWVLRDGNPVPVTVAAGLSNGTRTEVSGQGLQEGDAVITAMEIVTMADAEKPQEPGTGGSPFLPTPPKRNGNKGGAAKK